MKAFDRWLQDQRIARAGACIRPGARVLDIGCADGLLFRRLQSRIQGGIGIDPDVKQAVATGRYQLIPGRFPDDLPETAPFDVITMLAVLEHMPDAAHPRVAQRCAALLKPGGRLVITVPSPRVDRILELLKALRVSEPMSLEEHHHFDVRGVPELFRPLRLLTATTFELGLNHLFVFERPGPPAS